jgi:hypothetical protein
MSAFFVGAAHVDALLTFWREKARDKPDAKALSELGRMLLRENVRSLETRYRSDDHSEERQQAERYTFRPRGANKLRPIDLVSMCNCFDYQACETDDYECTEASALIDVIRKHAYYGIPDDNSVWHFQG